MKAFSEMSEFDPGYTWTILPDEGKLNNPTMNMKVQQEAFQTVNSYLVHLKL